MKTLELTKDDFRLFQDLLIEESGLYFAPDRSDTLESALIQRAEKREYPSFNEYYNLLKFHPEGRLELKNLIELLTIGETYFFRDPAQFEVLRDSVMPEIINRPSLKVWSAGCATGEEAYTIAMLLLEYLPDPANLAISILATDINREFLRRAKEGIYNERSVSRVPKELLPKYFTRHGSHYHLSDKVKQMVSFIYHNLARDPLEFENMRTADIIFCRNVTIYFNFETAKRIIEQFYSTLDDDGYLFLGYSETLWYMTNKFQAIEFPHTFIYKKALKPIKEEVRPFVDIPKIKIGGLPSLEVPSGVEITIVAEKVPAEVIDARIQLAKACTLANQVKYEDAIEELKKIIGADNLFVEAYYLMGVLYEKIGKLDDAIRELRRAVYVDPNLPIAYYNLGNIYLFQKMPLKAKREYQNAIKILQGKPRDELIHFSENLTNELLLIVCERVVEKLR